MWSSLIMDIISYSQAGQDVFVRLLTNFSPFGYFVDIGCQYPKCLNNTYTLEDLGWQGIMIDKDQKVIGQCKKDRLASVIEADLLQTNLIDIFTSYNVPKVIDYISMDIDWATDYVISNFPWDQYEFKIMTFEHDSYTAGPQLRDKSRELFESKGYVRVCSDVQNQGNSFEDWYINPKYIPREIYNNYVQSQVNYDQIFGPNINIIKRVD